MSEPVSRAEFDAAVARIWAGIEKVNDTVGHLAAVQAAHEARLVHQEAAFNQMSRRGFSVGMALFTAALSVGAATISGTVVGLLLR